MNCCPKCELGDLDDVFAYKTPVIARIRDRKLGLLRLFFSFLIIVYIGVYSIVANKGYARQGILRGNSRLAFRAPTVDNCDPEERGCKFDFTNPNKLAYCAQSSLPYPGRKFPCSQLLADQLVGGYGNGNQYFFATRRQVDLKYKNVYEGTMLPEYCEDDPDQDEPNCPSHSYATDIKKFTLLFDHGFKSNGIDVTASSLEMKGTVISKNQQQCDGLDYDSTRTREPNTVWKKWNGVQCEISPNKTTACLEALKRDNKYDGHECGYDIFTLGTVFETVRPSLPHLNSLGETNKTYRDQGMVMNIIVTYTNEETFFIKSIPSYTMEVATVPNQAAKWTSSELSFIGGNNTVAGIRDALPVEVNTRSAGMKINVIFNDDKVFGAFDFATLLDNLTSALALIAVASIIVDFFMLSKLSALRLYYSEVKFTNSVDFSDMSDYLKDNKHLSINSKMKEMRRMSCSVEGVEEGGRRRTAPPGHTETINPARPEQHSTESKGKQEMVELYRWKRTTNGGKEFVKISVPSNVLEEHQDKRASKGSM
jgi:hypothetical protein